MVGKGDNVSLGRARYGGRAETGRRKTCEEGILGSCGATNNPIEGPILGTEYQATIEKC
jgi:hypothetical protein